MKNLLFLLLCLTQLLFCTEEFRNPDHPSLPKHVLLINDTMSWYHWGCTGTATQLKISIIRDCGFFLSSVPIQANYDIVDFPQTADEFDNLERFELFKKSNRDLIATLEKSDVVVINGEGTLHGIKPGPLRLLYVAYLSKKFLGKHVEIINHSFYPQDTLEIDASTEATKIYQKVYSCIDFVAVREDLSAKLMDQMGIAATRSFDCLPLYIKENYPRTKRSHPTKDVLLLAGSAAWEQEGIKTLLTYIDLMIKKGYEVHFLIGAQKDLAPDDRRLVAFLQAHHPQGWKLVEAHSLQEWLQEIENASLLVSGRFHHSIAAACLNTPFIALNSNTPKIHALQPDLDSLEVLFYSDSELLPKLLSQTDYLIHQPFSFNHSEQILERLCKLSLQNFQGLKRIPLD